MAWLVLLLIGTAGFMLGAFAAHLWHTRNDLGASLRDTGPSISSLDVFEVPEQLSSSSNRDHTRP